MEKDDTVLRYTGEHCRVDHFVVPDGITKIERKAFAYCYNLKKIYIPASVAVVENDAFLCCYNVEIYCEDEPKEGWQYGMMKGPKEYSVTTPEDDAFNFHRSGGNFTSHTYTREEEFFHNWNPSDRPVHTHVGRDVIAQWEDPTSNKDS